MPVTTEKSSILFSPAPSPTVTYGVPFEHYLQWPQMSQSVLKCGRRSMRHLKCAMDGERLMKITDAMTLGSALHVAFLEPKEMGLRTACFLGPRRAGKEWIDFKAANVGKAILTEGMYENLCGMLKSLRSHPEVREWTKRITAVEVSGTGEIEGVQFKSRADAMTDDPMWDLKKVATVDDRTVTATIYEFGYHIQGYAYSKIFNRSRFCLGLVEEQPPHDVRVVELSERWMDIGRKETCALLQRYKWCLARNEWPGVSEKIDVMDPPDWVEQKFGSAGEITLAGATAFSEE